DCSRSRIGSYIKFVTNGFRCRVGPENTIARSIRHPERLNEYREDQAVSAKTTFDIAVLPGDGIGIDVTAEAVKVLQAVEKKIGSFTLNLKTYDCGAVCYQKTGHDLPPETLQAAKTADAVLLGAMGHPDIRKPDGTELVPQVTLRVLLDLFAGVRPCK